MIVYNLHSHAYLTQPLDFGKYSFIFTSDQLTQQKAHALLAKVLRFETQSKTQSKWV